MDYLQEGQQRRDPNQGRIVMKYVYDILDHTEKKKKDSMDTQDDKMINIL